MMPSENENRLDLSCLVGSLTATVVTRCGIVYQGTILDWNCGGIPNTRPDSSSSESEKGQKEEALYPRMGGASCCRSFIRMELSCEPGNICCYEQTVDTVVNRFSVVTQIVGSDLATPIYAAGTNVLINWDDVSSIGSIGLPIVCLTPE